MKILLIEDDVDIADFVKMELEHEGYAVQTAFDGRTGLDIALAADFGLILLDIMLPGLNGLEVLRRLRLVQADPRHFADRQGHSDGQGGGPGYRSQRLCDEAVSY